MAGLAQPCGLSVTARVAIARRVLDRCRTGTGPNRTRPRRPSGRGARQRASPPVRLTRDPAVQRRQANPDWTWDEEILAFDLYICEGFARRQRSRGHRALECPTGALDPSGLGRSRRDRGLKPGHAGPYGSAAHGLRPCVARARVVEIARSVRCRRCSAAPTTSEPSLFPRLRSPNTQIGPSSPRCRRRCQ
jgi:hypothetical protein